MMAIQMITYSVKDKGPCLCGTLEYHQWLIVKFAMKNRLKSIPLTF